MRSRPVRRATSWNIQIALARMPLSSVWSRSQAAIGLGLPSQGNTSRSSAIDPTSSPMSALAILKVEAGSSPCLARASSCTR
jgi:hypothetical protein